MVIFYKKWKKYNEIQLTKNKMDLNIRKMTNHPPSPPDVNNTMKLNLTINKMDLNNRQMKNLPPSPDIKWLNRISAVLFLKVLQRLVHERGSLNIPILLVTPDTRPTSDNFSH